MTGTKLTRRKPESAHEKKVKEVSTTKKNAAVSAEPNADPPPKYGPLPRISQQRIWSRAVLILGVLVYVWYTSGSVKEISLAKQKELLPKRGQSFDCEINYMKGIQQYEGCYPAKCGRFVLDKLVTTNEAETLLKVAQQGMALANSSGGVSILDLHSGALSYKDKFINVYTLGDKSFITSADLAVYKIVKDKIKHAIAENFALDSSRLFLTYPTFFSKLTNKAPKTKHDEYWHPHVDKETYESFHYTSLLYLADFSKDFKGGRFIFTDYSGKQGKNATVEPRKGRVLMFTSGAENPHFVERVVSGVRYAITVSFTCDSSKAIDDPVIP